MRPPARLVRHVLAHGVPVFSPATFAELELRLGKPKFDRYLSMELRRRILHDANAAAYWANVPGEIAVQRFCRDIDDDKFIHAARAATARWLVTGDQGLLDGPTLEDLSILGPAEALHVPEFGGTV